MAFTLVPVAPYGDISFHAWIEFCITNHSHECSFSHPCSCQLKRLSAFRLSFISMYLQYSIAFENKQVKFYTIIKPVAKSFVQMIMRKGFPLRDRINFKIRFVPLWYFANDIYAYLNTVGVSVDRIRQRVSVKTYAPPSSTFITIRNEHTCVRAYNVCVRLSFSHFRSTLWTLKVDTRDDGKGQINVNTLKCILLTSDALKLAETRPNSIHIRCDRFSVTST